MNASGDDRDWGVRMLHVARQPDSLGLEHGIGLIRHGREGPTHMYSSKKASSTNTPSLPSISRWIYGAISTTLTLGLASVEVAPRLVFLPVVVVCERDDDERFELEDVA